jgi:hypothetical protein
VRNVDVACDLLARVGRQLGTLRPSSTLGGSGAIEARVPGGLPHPALRLEPPLHHAGLTAAGEDQPARVQRRDLLGGLIHEYRRAARTPLRTQVAVWGLALGPGLFTHNHYAGIWLIPMMLALNGDAKQGAVVGALVGLGHGLSHAVGILRLIPNLEEWERPATIMLARFRWKLIDGLALVLAAGILMPRVL